MVKMGVTLERVQNKFACIIGELCSEPVVLSRFAIWLDLRLAEYKAKGAISLECSGEDPDPAWMKGHNSRPVRTKHVKEKEEFSGRSSSLAHRNSFGTPPADISSNSTLCTNNVSESDRLPVDVSDDVVVVKDEPAESEDCVIFPVTLHTHEHFNTNRSPRKRSAAETITSEHNFTESDRTMFRQQSPSFISQSPKFRRVALSSDIIAEPVSNQSLMEIISGDYQDPNDESDNILQDISVIDNGSHGGSRGNNSSLTFSSQPLASTSHTSSSSFSEYHEGQEAGSNQSNSVPPAALSAAPIQRNLTSPNPLSFASRICKAVVLQPGPVLFVRSLQKHIHKASVAVIRAELDALENRNFGMFLRKENNRALRRDCFFKPWPGTINGKHAVLKDARVTLTDYAERFNRIGHLKEDELEIVRQFHPHAELFII